MKEKANFRPPIVAVLGHVDHGKTTLLDRIRSTNVALREAGGITQSIGAWEVETKEGKKITLIDTPGHETFRVMRERGAKLADIVVLAVAADDGVMPQTQESLEYIKETKIPYLIAITKVDAKGADLERVKTQLEKEGVLLEQRGGDVVCVETSAKTGQGILELLELIELIARLNEISGSTEDKFEAVVLETLVDKSKGPIVRAVVRKGTLKVGDSVFAEQAEQGEAKVRGMFKGGKPVDKAFPGNPVDILGFEKLPKAGVVLKESKEEGIKKAEENPPAGGKALLTDREGFRHHSILDLVKIVLKADTWGSLEALSEALVGKVGILEKGLGDVNKNDIFLAKTTGAFVVGFCVDVSKDIKKLAEEEGVLVRSYKIIYELIEDIKNWDEEKDKTKQKIVGRASILAQFPYNKKRIAGCRVENGVITRGCRLGLLHNGQLLGSAKVLSLRKKKEEVSKAGEGEEFGVLLDPQLDFQVGDVLECYAHK